MANIKSAKKRIKVNKRQRSENKFLKTTVNTLTKKFRKLIKEGNLVEAEKTLAEVIKLIDSSASKGVFHKNNASRKVSRLSKALSDAKNETTETAEVKETEVAKEVKEEVAEVKEVKEETKKPAAKKTTTAKKAEEVKKPAAKKATTTTKTATKATTAKKAETTEEVKKPATKKAATTAKTTTAKKTTTKKAE